MLRPIFTTMIHFWILILWVITAYINGRFDEIEHKKDGAIVTFGLLFIVILVVIFAPYLNLIK